ncbi:MAG: hypothetical protein LQ338_003111 [Usnochroma carphineum]|nr:MAG: hypothetical protein LQ338_003111 [Usnochroma carphineum]
MSETDPTRTPSSSAQHPANSTHSYLSYPVSHVVSGLYRRLTEPPQSKPSPPPSLDLYNGVYTPPRRTASPFQPPPLTPLTLNPAKASSSSLILTRALAEEIRLLVPPRLQLSETWSLVYSLEEDGVSLTTLYNKCAAPSVPQSSSFVLVVKDAAGGIFGAYLTDPPRPSSSSFYGTGECFLWRSSLLPSSSSLLSSLPPPPSAPESASLGRCTTLVSPTSAASSTSHRKPSSHNPVASAAPSTTSSSSPSQPPPSSSNAKNGRYTPSPSPSRTGTGTGTSTPSDHRIRFKAFPYSGINDYLIFCEQGFLSVGGGDGRYGLWLDGVLERGVSSPCLTFGNEGLSEEGEKFEVVGVEVWSVG